jgi:hypothetical protein
LTQEWTQQPGDVVAIPAGWWHVARHAGTRSVHLTLGLGPSSREQWRRWLAERPRQSLVVTVPWRPRTMADGRRVVEVAGRRWSYPRRLAALIEGLAVGPGLAGAAPDGVATLADLASAGLVRPPSWGVSGSWRPRRRVS